MSISVCSLIVLVVLVASCSDAFAPSPTLSTRRPFLPLLVAKESLQLSTSLSPAEIANLATTASHSKSKSGTWSESIAAEETCTRFIVEGEGSITLTSADGETIRRRIGPGSLIEVKGAGGEGQLLWDVDDEMMILYSGEVFDEEQKLAVGLLAVLFGVVGLAYSGMGV